jgi:Flp pilus assembly protein TadB
MAIGWMTALKVIPWGDVIEATPGIVKSARKIFTRSQQAEEAATAPAAAGDPGARIAHLEASLAELAEQQKASAQLIETLAEQNARIVEAVDTLRVRTRFLIAACALLTLACVALAVWGLR